MPDIMLRYDMRIPSICAASSASMYKAAIAQCAWGENHGFTSVHISEHHGSEDGYLPAPLLLAAAVAARTSRMMIYLSALIAPLHDPVTLAEELAVLDIISEGRVIPLLGAGYREEEFAALGKSLSDRKQYMDDIGSFLRQAWTGEPFDYRGRRVRVTPRPHSSPRPPLLMGGSSRAAARRAARDADFFIPTSPRVFDLYREERAKLGKLDPGPMPQAPSTVSFVARDPDQYWELIAPHLMHEMNSYAAWAEQAGVDSPYRFFRNADDLRDSGAYRVYRPAELVEAALVMAASQPIQFHPLCGGIPPEVAWQSLDLWAADVWPQLQEAAGD